MGRNWKQVQQEFGMITFVVCMYVSKYVCMYILMFCLTRPDNVANNFKNT